LASEGLCSMKFLIETENLCLLSSCVLCLKEECSTFMLVRETLQTDILWLVLSVMSVRETLQTEILWLVLSVMLVRGTFVDNISDRNFTD
jgi:hypothetical protein